MKCFPKYYSSQRLPSTGIKDAAKPVYSVRPHDSCTGRQRSSNGVQADLGRDIGLLVAADVPGMHRVRMSVRENRLVSTVITEEDTRKAIEETGRGWVVDVEGQIVGFAIVNLTNSNVWALFMDPAHERKGYGRQLHDEMLEWSWSQDLTHLWLSTEPGTRAQRFYGRAGWKNVGRTEKGEVRFEKLSPHRLHEE